MEMSLLETVRLLALDIQLAVIATLLVLHSLERAAGAAWLTFRETHSERPEAVRTRVKIGKIRPA